MIISSRMEPRRPKSAFKLITSIMLVLFFLLACAAAVLYYLVPERSNTAHANPKQPFNGLAKPIFYQGVLAPETAIGENDGLKLPFTAAKEIIDPTILFEKSTESIIITTLDKVIRLRSGGLTGMVNEKPFDLRFSVDTEGDTVYLPVTPFIEYYPVNLREVPDTGAVFISKTGDVIQWGLVAANPQDPDAAEQEEGKPAPTVAMRSKASIQAPIYADLLYGSAVMIWEETANGWYKVQLDNGYIGYVDKANIKLDHTEVIKAQQPKEASYVPWKPTGGKINLTWEQVIKKTPDTSKFTAMNGLNVVSPTWFHLTDDKGNLISLADTSYVKWAHSQDKQVWGLFSNGFKPDWTTAALATYDLRMKMIKQLLAYAQLYDLQGINVDFENIYLKDKANLTQFIREMTPLLHEQGLVVSVDVTVRGGSEMWSQFADRRALGEVVDYMMVMTYDEHWASSPTAGSVASLPWVEKGILDIIKEDQVPASKILIGVPYYTRIWAEETLADGTTKVTSKAVSMETVNKKIAEHQLTPVYLPDQGQNYVEYMEDGKQNKIWMEDEVSIRARVELIKKYNLAGVASWRRGFETPEIWDVIQTTLEQRP